MLETVAGFSLEGKNKIIPVLTLKAHEGVQVSLHLLFTSALGGVN
jgi:hypothetical protein